MAARTPAAAAPAPHIHNPPGREQWEPIRIDQPTPAFESHPPPGPYRPDTICDGWSTPHLTVRMASVRGAAHRQRGDHRQDHAVVVAHPSTGAVLFAVMDGVSSAALAHVGAERAGHAALRTLWRLLDRAEDIHWGRVLRAAADALVRDPRYGLAPGEDLSDVERRLGTTIITGAVRPAAQGTVVTMVRVGDSGAWLLRDSHYTAVFDTGDAAAGVIETAVRALPRLPDPVQPVELLLPPEAVLLVGTDGIGDPLGDGTGLVGQLLAGTFRRPPPALGLAHTIDFSRETFDDDRTLLAVWPRIPTESP